MVAAATTPPSWVLLSAAAQPVWVRCRPPTAVGQLGRQRCRQQQAKGKAPARKPLATMNDDSDGDEHDANGTEAMRDLARFDHGLGGGDSDDD